MAPYLAGLPQKRERVLEVLSHLGLGDRRHAKIKELSQGQAQRVAIARAIMNKPEVILADEPTSALDDTNCGRVIDLLLQVAAETNATVVVATHDHRLKQHIQNQIAL
jgi:putative ABC transport system ATP-binding protein